MSYSKYTPDRKYKPISEIDNDDLDKNDMMAYLSAMLKDPKQSMTIHQEISSFNKFTDIGINYIIQALFNISRPIINPRTTSEVDKSINSFTIKITFTEAVLDTPKTINKSGVSEPRFPDDYRINNEFYAAQLILNANISITAHKKNGTEEIKETTIEKLRISSIPIMVGSTHCNTYLATPEMKKNMNEDITDTGGYFITNGKEYVITALENIVYNQPTIFKSTIKSERVYGTILSQRGGIFGNSTQLAIRLQQDYGIYFEIQTLSFQKFKIPFYIIYKIFGMTGEEDIAKMIVYDYDLHTHSSDKMMEYISSAFRAKYNLDKKIQNLFNMDVNIIALFDYLHTLDDSTLYKKDDNAIRDAINSMRKNMDKSILPHVGTSSSSRTNKLLHISMMIREIIMVDMGIRIEDDRDHYTFKRAHGAGISLSKTFKTLFNTKIVQIMQNTMIGDIMNKSFETINITDLGITLRNLVQSKELEIAFIKYINAAEKDNVRTKEKIRMNAQPLERKNKINVMRTMRTITTTMTKVAKSTKRSDKMRYWHPSATGLICPFQTQETGEKVGIVKQLALTAIITSDDEDGIHIKSHIKKDPELIPLMDVELITIARDFLAKIYVDGEWLGCCKDPDIFVKRYRNLRREGVLDRFTSISWDSISNVINFTIDPGRLMRPLLIVDNNLDEVNSGKVDPKDFTQNIRLDKDIIYKLRREELTFEDLIQMGYVEYIYPGEDPYCAASIYHLQADKHNIIRQYTHCDIPQVMFGIAASIGPLLDRNQPFRNTMVAIHAAQACGQPITNIQTASRRSQKFHQHKVEVPLLKTITQEMFPPNSQNAMTLYAMFLGYNQEDSSILNKQTVERGMLKGVYYKMDTIEIEKNQSVRQPRPRETMYIRNNPYNKLDESGVVEIGQMVQPGDIVVGIVVELAQVTENGKRFLDKSSTYENNEPGRVVSVVTKLDGEDKFIMITYEYERTMSIGD